LKEEDMGNFLWFPNEEQWMNLDDYDKRGVEVNGETSCDILQVFLIDTIDPLSSKTIVWAAYNKEQENSVLKDMTVEEIEEALGYKIRIVS
jgi:hypothetical protein